jgi:hypothetical protein
MIIYLYTFMCAKLLVEWKSSLSVIDKMYMCKYAYMYLYIIIHTYDFIYTYIFVCVKVIGGTEIQPECY